jgi:hypothetical protein
MTKYWNRTSTKEWIAQLENRLEDLDYYLNRTIEWAEENNIIGQEKIFSLGFVTVLWVCHMRSEDVSRQEVYELLGVEDWQDADDCVMELGDQLSDMDYEDMLTLVSRTLSK